MPRPDHPRPVAPVLLALAAVLLPWAAAPARAQVGGADTAAGAAGGGSAAGGSAATGGAASGATLPDPGLVPGGMATAPGELPVRLGGFFDSPYGGPVPLGGTAPARSWTIQPSIGIQLLATDNAFQGSDGERQADFVTSISPGLIVTGDSARLQTSFRYSPSLQLYAASPRQDRIDHRFNGTAVATLLPGSVYLDMRASAAALPITGTRSASDEATLPRNDRTQTFNFSLSPYYIQRYGGLATSIIGYAFQYADQGGRPATLTPGGAPFFTPQDFMSHTGFASLRTGEDFGPLAVEARLSGTTYSGGGVLDGAHRALGIVETRYAFNRVVTGLVEAGYEDQEYGGVPPVRISEAVWSVGLRLDPGPRSMILLRYQRRNGYDAPRIDARVGIGARTVLSASYSDEITTFARLGADLLSQTSVDALGNPVDTRTGAPARDASGGGLLSTQNGLFRSRRATARLSQVWDRDTISLELAREERIPISVQDNTTAFRQESHSIGASWSHALSFLTSLTGSVRYGRTQSAGLGPDGDTYAVRATLAHRFNENLVGSLQYLLTNRSTDLLAPGDRQARGDTLQNAVIATLRQSF
ncbi:hypothetical protein [Roseomonas sp. BN140053]|uniref:hypothetical protein n=1 Tax=Roseomonas sp. BN140053 TaxID=3391898 RepID=UPI0039E8850A